MKNSNYEVPLRIFYYRICVHHKYRSLDPDVEMEWKDNHFQRFMRWTWYFEYRAALLRIKFPRSVHVIHKGNYIAKNSHEIQKAHLTRLKNRLKNNKGRITQWKNKIQSYKEEIEKFKNEWNSLFPVENDPGYKIYIENIYKAQEKLSKKKIDLAILEDKIKELENQII